jgi:hypothetical protein
VCHFVGYSLRSRHHPCPPCAQTPSALQPSATPPSTMPPANPLAAFLPAPCDVVCVTLCVILRAAAATPAHPLCRLLQLRHPLRHPH